MADQVTVKSVSVISEDYLRVVRFLEENAAIKISIARGTHKLPEVKLPEDITDITKLKEALPTKTIDEQIDKVQGSETEVGSIGDLQSLAVQSDTVARLRRMCASRYANRDQRRLQSLYRQQRHSGKTGYWIAHKLNKLQSLQKRMQ